MELKNATDPGDFTARRFVRTMAHWGSVAAALVGSCLVFFAGAGLGFWEALLVRVFLGAYLGFAIAGVVYLRFVVKELRSLQAPEAPWDEHETLLMQSRGSTAHFPGGNRMRVFHAVGGRLFLTDLRLVFRAHRGQPRVYEMSVPLNEIARAQAGYSLWVFRNWFWIELPSGRRELFNFAVGIDASQWVDAIAKTQSAFGVVPEQPA